ncbi:hypothetical protein CR513_21013, partial [Mucuna pruriens]
MTRSRSSSSLHSFDLEIDKTLNRIRKTKNINVGNSSSSFNSVSESDTFKNKPDIADNPLYKPKPMENNNRTLKELATPNLESAQSYELKSGHIHLLPKFHDLASEDPTKHLKEFHDEVARDPGRLYKNKGIFLLSRSSSKGLTIFAAGHVQHMGRHEADVLGKRPRLRPSGRRYVESGNTLGKHCISIGRGSTSCVPRVHIIKSVNNFYCNNFMKVC